MLNQNRIKGIFKDKISEIKIKETVWEYSCRLVVNGCTFNLAELFDFFEELPKRDKLTLKIYCSDLINISASRKEDYNSAKKTYQEIVDFVDEDDELPIEITVKKSILDNTLSVYDFNQFKQILFKKNISDFLEMCKDLYDKSNEHLNFEALNENIHLQSEFLSIVPFERDTVFRKSFRETIKENSIGICNFESPFELPFIPEDFDVYDYDTSAESEEIKNYFENIKFILSVFYIADYSKIMSSSVYFSVAGYRKMEKIIDLSEEIKPNPIFYEIYKWLYSGGNIYDKAQIARNILTLHCRYSDILEISSSILETIRSNYNLYLKDNVKDYLQLKKDITESILDHCNNISEALNKLSGYFKGNFIAIFGFIATLYFSEGIKENGFVNLFTGQTAIVTSFVLLGSFVLMGFSLYEVSQKEKFYKKKIDALKQNYEDVVERGELEQLIDKNELLILAEEQYKNSTKIIGVIWFISIVALFLALDVLSGPVKLLFFWNIFN